MKSLAVIPARYSSTRFPGKPLALLAGKPMVQHVWERCCSAAGVDQVIIATEDERIRAACSAFGAPCEMTSAGHRSGTDRVAEVARRHAEYEIVLNVQGDEPAIAAETIAAVVAALREGGCMIATPVAPAQLQDVSNPNVVKVVLSLAGDALYFSRAPIPHHRDGLPSTRPEYLRHIGLYGFRREALLKVAQLSPSPLEVAESLEQLRWLQAGFVIRCVAVKTFSAGVDTPEDLKILEKFWRDTSR
ncbi:MAG: 3-deoxy-manno-octulosonate cytidylyltransferase [bacterium]|nr:3-deoxy-manno-octulosonate cytidylyltransferase [bacterium]